MILVASLVLGVVGSAAPERISSAVSMQFQAPWASFFWAGLTIFGALALYGIFTPKIEGLLVERIALAALTLFYVTFAVAVVLYAGLGGLVSTALPLAFAVGNVARIVQVRQDLALLKSYLKDHPGEEVR